MHGHYIQLCGLYSVGSEKVFIQRQMLNESKTKYLPFSNFKKKKKYMKYIKS